MKLDSRTDKFTRNENLEIFLREINSDLTVAEDEIVSQIAISREWPVIFVVGPLRSGSTMCTQWLANTGEFAYPTNMMSRFYQAPIIGAKIQRLLTDPVYNFRNEILDFNSEKMEYKSENGKTKGALSPNEFWYFWRNYLPYKNTDIVSDEELMESKMGERFKKEIYGICEVFQKPYICKGMIANYNIGYFSKLFPHAIFIYTSREISSNMESVLKARERQLGSVDKWYSFDIPEKEELMKIKDPIMQSAGQLYFIKKNVEDGLRLLPEHRKMVIQYEEFCSNPEKYYIELRKKLSANGIDVSEEYTGEHEFKVTRNVNQTYLDIFNQFVAQLESDDKSVF